MIHVLSTVLILLFRPLKYISLRSFKRIVHLKHYYSTFTFLLAPFKFSFSLQKPLHEAPCSPSFLHYLRATHTHTKRPSTRFCAKLHELTICPRDQNESARARALTNYFMSSNTQCYPFLDGPDYTHNPIINSFHNIWKWSLYFSLNINRKILQWGRMDEQQKLEFERIFVVVEVFSQEQANQLLSLFFSSSSGMNTILFHRPSYKTK